MFGELRVLMASLCGGRSRRMHGILKSLPILWDVGIRNRYSESDFIDVSGGWFGRPIVPSRPSVLRLESPCRLGLRAGETLDRIKVFGLSSAITVVRGLWLGYVLHK